MKMSELRSKTENELRESLKKLKSELKDVNLSLVQKKEKNLRKPYLMRRNVARILTVIKEKELINLLENSSVPVAVVSKETKAKGKPEAPEGGFAKSKPESKSKKVAKKEKNA